LEAQAQGLPLKILDINADEARGLYGADFVLERGVSRCKTTACFRLRYSPSDKDVLPGALAGRLRNRASNVAVTDCTAQIFRNVIVRNLHCKTIRWFQLE
jgi:hypothetical protein